MCKELDGVKQIWLTGGELVDVINSIHTGWGREDLSLQIKDKFDEWAEAVLKKHPYKLYRLILQESMAE